MRRTVAPALVALGLGSTSIGAGHPKPHPAHAAHASHPSHASPRAGHPQPGPIARNPAYRHATAGSWGIPVAARPGIAYHAGSGAYWGHHRYYPHSHHHWYSASNRVGPSSGWQAARLRHLEYLKRQLDGIGIGSTPTPAQVEGIGQGLSHLAQGSSPLAASTARPLSTTLARALAGRGSATVDHRNLVLDLEEVVNHRWLSATEVNHAISRGQSALVASGVGAGEARSVAAAMRDLTTGHLGGLATR